VRSASSASSPCAAVLHLVQGSRRAASGAVVSDRTHMDRTARSSVGPMPNDPAMHLNPTAAMPCRGLKSQQSGSVSGRRPARSGASMTRPCCRRIGAAAWAGGGRPSRSRSYAGRGPHEACGRPKSPADSWPCPKPENVAFRTTCWFRTAPGCRALPASAAPRSTATQPLTTRWRGSCRPASRRWW
jgi:hypothetical protein